MEFRKLIEKRKSVRKFLLGGEKPDWRKIIRAIDYARFIPAAGNEYNLKFILHKIESQRSHTKTYRHLYNS